MKRPRPPYRVVESRLIYKGHIIRLVKDRFVLDRAPGKIVTRELIDHPGAVVVLPFVSRDRILLLRQFRYASQGDLWEIPAGTLEPGEDTLVCAKRELEEETGHRASRWKLLTRFFCAPGISNEVMTLYAAGRLRPGRKDLDHDEFIEHVEMPLKDALKLARNGKVRDGKTLVGLLWASAYLPHGF
ncbi:MAG: ADP-ribose pyrophosphatase [Candidatus Omnitrophica bacterium]|nr:ADP-ribose pyrophosphatase [Candidatus Omnitrophota bacterium]